MANCRSLIFANKTFFWKYFEKGIDRYMYFIYFCINQLNKKGNTMKTSSYSTNPKGRKYVVWYISKDRSKQFYAYFCSKQEAVEFANCHYDSIVLKLS